jgi:hypothetical protein
MLCRCNVSSVKFSTWVNSSSITLNRATPIVKHQGHTFSMCLWKFRLTLARWLKRNLTRERTQSTWFWSISTTSRGPQTKSTRHSACYTNHSSTSTHLLLSHRQVTNSRTKRQLTLSRTAVKFWKVISGIWRLYPLLRNQISWNISSESVVDSLNFAVRSLLRVRVNPEKILRWSVIFWTKKASPTHSRSKMRPSQGWSASPNLKVSIPHGPTSISLMMKIRSLKKLAQTIESWLKPGHCELIEAKLKHA